MTMPEKIPISALQHWLYCPRQCALIHLERAWAENHFTAQGRVMHERCHKPGHESRPGVRITRSLPVASEGMGLTGVCDVVEFHTDGTVLPVEYKRGKPKAHRADEVQVCAQAMCLEEMRSLPAGAIQRACLYYGEHRRRHDVFLDAELRSLTAATAARLHAMFDSAITPEADYDPKRCDACSLIDICQPKALRFKRGAQAWFAARVTSERSEPGFPL